MIYNEVLKREIPRGWNHGTAEDLFSFNPSVSLVATLYSGCSSTVEHQLPKLMTYLSINSSS
jgi:hypothetical protein